MMSWQTFFSEFVAFAAGGGEDVSAVAGAKVVTANRNEKTNKRADIGFSDQILPSSR